jgi:DNA-binding response OmpR family regulator
LLIKNGFNVISAHKGDQTLQKLTRYQPDFLLFDLDGKHSNGWGTVESINKLIDLPMILLSTNVTKEDIINGLRSGADDYLSKPYHPGELVERIRSILRRTKKKPKNQSLDFENELAIDMTTREVNYKGHNIHLAPKEFTFLSLLARNYPAVVSYETIGEHVWSKGTDKIRKRTNYLVYLLRQKFTSIEEDFDLIRNVDRIGYRLVVGDDD